MNKLHCHHVPCEECYKSSMGIHNCIKGLPESTFMNLTLQRQLRPWNQAVPFQHQQNHMNNFVILRLAFSENIDLIKLYLNFRPRKKDNHWQKFQLVVVWQSINSIRDHLLNGIQEDG